MSFPIKNVVLYKHGVGYFERLGEVQDNGSIQLHFRRSEMNDVLKSLTTVDLDGGIISSISYESFQSTEHKLKDIAVHLPENNTLVSLLGQIKGAQVTIELSSGEVTGKVMGLDQSKQEADGVVLTLEYLVLLVAGQEFHRYELSEIKKICLVDVSLRDELQHLLDVLFSANKKDMKQLSIFANGKGKRRILTSYVIESPVWKTSYRIMLGTKKSLIQGWAIVDNTMDEDWNEISLTLVAGLPISFVHDLYTSRYKRRPEIKVEEEAAYAPPLLEAGEVWGMEEMLQESDAVAAAAPAARLRGLENRSRKPAVSKAKHAAESVEVKTVTAEVGDLFQYEIGHAINVKRGQSALVPIVQEAFAGKRVAIYNRDVRDKNPMSAVLFKNTTGMTLEGGPLTVLDEDVYVGEAMLETMHKDEEKIVPFSVELGCEIKIDRRSSREAVHFARASHGYLYLYRYELNKTIYVVNNKTERSIDLFLDHPFTKDWELISEPKPVEETENFYRLRYDVPEKSVNQFEVVEKGETYESHDLEYIKQEQVAMWLRKKYITDDIRTKLESVIETKARINGIEIKLNKLSDEREEIFQNQERLRKNLKTLGSARDEQSLRERYIAALNKEEDKLAEIKAEITVLETKLEEAKQTLMDEIKNVQYDITLQPKSK
ncbi:hypothetical protein [Kaarinaea lacus]